MARTEARIFTSIWRDDDFLALPGSAQRLYLFLLSQEDLTYCGVIPLRERRWAPKAAGLSISDIEQDLKALDATGRHFVIVDTETGELLIRSFMRNDEVWKQPNLMKAARSAAAQVESEAIRAAILDELRRIPAAGSSSRFVREVHAAFLQDMEKGFPNPSGNPSANPSGNPGGTAEGDVSPGQEDAGNPSPNPSAEAKPNPPGNRSPKASANPSQERGEGYGVNQGEPLSPELLPTGDAGKGSPKGSANPSTAQELVADWLEHCRKRPPDRVVGQVAKELGILLDEGQDPADIRRGLAAWHLAAKHPSTLASFVNEVMNGSSARGRPGSAGRLQRGGASDELAHEEYGKGKTRI